jgi:hypothetical protein
VGALQPRHRKAQADSLRHYKAEIEEGFLITKDEYIAASQTAVTCRFGISSACTYI